MHTYIVNIIFVIAFIAVVTFLIMSGNHKQNHEHGSEKTSEQSYCDERLKQHKFTNILLLLILIATLFNTFPTFFEWLYWLNQVSN